MNTFIVTDSPIRAVGFPVLSGTGLVKSYKLNNMQITRNTCTVSGQNISSDSEFPSPDKCMHLRIYVCFVGPEKQKLS